jgi:midasin
MVSFLAALHRDATVKHNFGSTGGPWEFNLRDLLRWCELVESAMGDERSVFTGVSDGEADELVAVQHFAQLLFVQRMRMEVDRAHIRSTFAATFASSIPPWSATMALSPRDLRLGWTSLSRTAALECDDEDCALTPCRMPLLASLGECVSQKWMCLLVGPSSTGKTSAVRTLATLCGRPLVEMSLTSGTDTSDLLGGFEQLDAGRRTQELVSAVNTALTSLASLAVTAAEWTAVESAQTLAATWERAQAREHTDVSVDALARVAQTTLAGLRALSESLSGEDLPPALAALHAASQLAERVLLECGESTGRFSWVDGVLTR